MHEMDKSIGGHQCEYLALKKYTLLRRALVYIKGQIMLQNVTKLKDNI